MRCALQAITAGVGELEAMEGVKAFVLTSKFEGKVFSAGLDLLEMHAPESRGDLETFFRLALCERRSWAEAGPKLIRSA